MMFPSLPRLLLLALPLAFVACKKDKIDDPTPDNQDNEVITTLRYTLTPVGGGPALVVQYRDADGDGGAAPVFTFPGTGNTRLILPALTTYTGRVLLLDETKSPVDTISNEVYAERNDHLLVYNVAPAGLLTVVRTDRDTNAPPLEVGLETRLDTGPIPGPVTMQIILRHQPGLKDGTAAPGDTDVDVTFPVQVQ